MKLTFVVNFINIFVQIFHTNVVSAAFLLLHVCRKSCWNDVRTKNVHVKHWWNWLLDGEEEKPKEDCFVKVSFNVFLALVLVMVKNLSLFRIFPQKLFFLLSFVAVPHSPSIRSNLWIQFKQTFFLQVRKTFFLQVRKTFFYKFVHNLLFFYV
jgi:hypothetical protein